MKNAKTSKKSPNKNSSHAGQLLWTMAVAVIVVLILLRQETATYRGKSSGSLIEPQRSVAATAAIRAIK